MAKQEGKGKSVSQERRDSGERPEDKGRAGFSYALPGQDEAEEYENPGEFWKRVSNETGMTPEQFAVDQGYDTAEDFLEAARGDADGLEDEDEDEEEEEDEE